MRVALTVAVLELMLLGCAAVFSIFAVDQVHQNAGETVSVLKPIVAVFVDALQTYDVELVLASAATSYLQVMSILLAELCSF